MTSANDLVLVRRSDACITMTLNRPEHRNALTFELFSSLNKVVEPLIDDSSIRVVVLTGAGDSFCVGGDLGARSRGEGIVTSDAELSTQRLAAATRIVELFEALPQVTIAAINGACAGAGLSLAAACDLGVASKRAKFNTAFLGAGASGDFAGIWHVTRLIGAGRARDLFLQSEPFTADHAAHIGLLTEAVEADALTSRVSELASSLAARAPSALRALKANLVDASRLSLHEYVVAENARYVRVGGSEDSQEAARAFIEGRPPVFQRR